MKEMKLKCCYLNQVLLILELRLKVIKIFKNQQLQIIFYKKRKWTFINQQYFIFVIKTLFFKKVERYIMLIHF